MSCIRTGTGTGTGTAEASRLEITVEDIEFLKEHGVDLGTKVKLRKRLERLQPGEFATYKMQQQISKCMKEMDLAKAKEAYSFAREEGVTIGKDSQYALLSLAAGLGEQGCSLGPARKEEPPSDYNMALTLFQEMKVSYIG